MSEARTLDSELYLPTCDRARFSWAGREYEGRLALDAGWALGLLALELTPEAYGGELYEAVFPAGSALREGLREALGEAERTGCRLRFRLHLSPGLPDWMHALYWELLADEGGRLSLARSPDTAFSRYSTVRSSLGRPAPGRPRILAAVAAPLDGERFRLAEIDRDAVLDRLIAIFGESYAFELEILEPPVTLDRLRERLVVGGFHLLHLVGHGLIESRGVSALVLENEEGKARFVGEELLAETLLGLHELRLVTLMACHGGAPSSPDTFSGLAGRLVERGLPAVVAMRRRVSFADAELFTLHLYRHLARAGRIDEAVNEARQQLYLKAPGGITWSSPVLYSRLADGRLWQPEAEIPPPVVTVVAPFPEERRAAIPILGALGGLSLLALLAWLAAERLPAVVNKVQIGSPIFRSTVHSSTPILLAGRPEPSPQIFWPREAPTFRRPQVEPATPLEPELPAEIGPVLATIPVQATLDSSRISHPAFQPTEAQETRIPPAAPPDEPSAPRADEPADELERPLGGGGHVPAQCRASLPSSIGGGEKPIYKIGLVATSTAMPVQGDKETQAALVGEVLDAATEAFASSRRFTVIERKELGAVFKEKDLKNFLGKGDNRLSDLFDLDQLGIVSYRIETKKVPQRWMRKIREKIDSTGDSSEEVKVTIWTIDVRLVDVKTGQDVKTISSENSSGLVPVPTLREAAKLLQDHIREAYPPYGILVKADGKNVTIDLGEAAGLQKNDELEVLEEGEQLVHPVTGKLMAAYLVVIGEIRLTEIWPTMANGKITSSKQGKEIKRGCFVRFKGAGCFWLRPPVPSAHNP